MKGKTHSHISSDPSMSLVKCSHPLTSNDTSNNFSINHNGFLAAIQTEVEPTRLFDAIKHPKWQATMQREINALENNDTWTLTTLLSNKNALSYKWVYRIKL